MHIRSTGAKRLSLVLGTLGGIAALITAFIISDFPDRTFTDLDTYGLFILFILFPTASFTIPFFLTRAVTWILEGFKRPPSRKFPFESN